MRLTLLYASLFLLLGTVLLGIIYALARGSSTIAVHAVRVSNGPRQGVVLSPIVGNVSAAPSPRGFVDQVLNSAVAQHNADNGRLLEISWVVLLLTTLGAAGLGWIAAGRVLRPLRSITATARTISAGSLHQRLALEGPDDEFKQLGDTLDDLLGRLEASFEAQRRFVANASHELRTPLTVERAVLQVALADPNATTESLRAACAELLATQDEHEQLLESLLTLASSERGLERREPVDLQPLAESVLDASRGQIERAGLTLTTSLEPAPSTGDAALIRRLIVNLIDNAIDYNTEGGRLEVATASDASHAVLTVSNTGPSIPPEETQRLFEPFQRLTAQRTDTTGHHGLGLSIVRAIADAHDADLTPRAQPAGGLAVTVRFPSRNGAGARRDSA
jgi:signal transduction histidine kinase